MKIVDKESLLFLADNWEDKVLGRPRRHEAFMQKQPLEKKIDAHMLMKKEEEEKLNQKVNFKLGSQENKSQDPKNSNQKGSTLLNKSYIKKNK